MYVRIVTIIICFLILSLIHNCATRGRPSGGPVDKTPPEIIYTFPAKDSLGVSNLEEIQIYFSERMNESSVKNALFISPPLEYEIDWSGGDELTLELQSDSLLANQTYVITIGSGAQDSRKNRMKESYQFAFSTGDYLDQGMITGKIFGLSKKEVAYIYAFQTTNNDTIDPRYNKAKFLTQSGEGGKYQLNYLPLTKYRVFVIEDQNKNLILDAAYERVGIPSQDILLDSLNAGYAGLNFKLTSIDTLAPFVSSARAMDNRTILLRSSEELITLDTNNLQIADTLSSKNLKIRSIVQSSQSESQYLLYTAIQDSNAYYEVIVSDIADTNNNKQPENSIVYFSGSNKKDTTKFELISFQPPDSTVNFPIYSPVKLSFSLPVDLNSFNEAFHFIREQNDTLDGIWNWKELKDGTCFLKDALEPGINYRVDLHTGIVRSVWGDTLPDTLYSHFFTTTSTDEYGSISGTINLESSKFSKLFLTTKAAKGSKKIYRAEKIQNNGFVFNWLPEGYYVFTGFLDIDGNGSWSPGKLVPFEFAEPSFVLEDTVRVRKRWETGEVNIEIKGW